MPPSTAGTSASAKRCPQAVEPSTENSVLHTVTSIGRPSMPPSCSFTKSTPAPTAWLSSGNEPAGVFSWLIIPRRMGSPEAATGPSGTNSAMVEARAQSNRASPLQSVSATPSDPDPAVGVSTGSSESTASSGSGSEHPTRPAATRRTAMDHVIARHAMTTSLPSWIFP